MFQFPGCAPCIKYTVIECYSMGFPHSEISGSKVVWHLPETYRSQTTSFIAPFSQGIRHAPLMELPVRNSTNRFCVLHHLQMSMLVVYVPITQTTLRYWRLKLLDSPGEARLNCSFDFSYLIQTLYKATKNAMCALYGKTRGRLGHKISAETDISSSART